MPCRDPYPSDIVNSDLNNAIIAQKATQKKADHLTKMLCKACGKIRENDPELLDEELKNWYDKHVVDDARRIIEDALKEARKTANIGLKFPCNLDEVDFVKIEDFSFHPKD